MRKNVIRRRQFESKIWCAFASIILLGACSESPAPLTGEVPASELLGQGEAMVENLCAGCHAIGEEDQSQHPDAPPLRDLSKRLNLDDLRQPLQEGLMIDHPDMPGFAFEPQHVDALLYYLQSIQTADQ